MRAPSSLRPSRGVSTPELVPRAPSPHERYPRPDVFPRDDHRRRGDGPAGGARCLQRDLKPDFLNLRLVRVSDTVPPFRPYSRSTPFIFRELLSVLAVPSEEAAMVPVPRPGVARGRGDGVTNNRSRSVRACLRAPALTVCR